MIAFLVSKLESGFKYCKEHPNLLIILAVMLLLPLLLYYTNQQYLAAGLENQERLQKDRVGLMHDVLVSLLNATDFNPTVAQAELERIAKLNPDIVEFRIARQQGADIIPVAALDLAVVNQPDPNPQFYQNALVRLDESLIFPALEAEGRQWYTYRAVQTETGTLYFIYTKISLAAVDTAFANNTQSANWSFVYVYFFIGLLALWHVKMTDYKHLYDQTRQMNEMKDLFTNTIAHELRAPLTAIRGYASMIGEKVPDEQKTHAERIQQSSERLLNIVNDLLDVARIQSGRLSVAREAVVVPALIEKVCAELGVSLQGKNITLTNENKDDEIVAQSDPKRLQQALTNLVSNAIKYTEQGEIKISVSEAAEQVEVRVKDTGMGIDAENQKKLFAPFFRVSSDKVSEITGTGLGMWITKELIEMMGGTVAVESIKGVGTHVVVRLPRRK